MRLECRDETLSHLKRAEVRPPAGYLLRSLRDEGAADGAPRPNRPDRETLIFGEEVLRLASDRLGDRLKLAENLGADALLEHREGADRLAKPADAERRSERSGRGHGRRLRTSLP